MSISKKPELIGDQTDTKDIGLSIWNLFDSKDSIAETLSRSQQTLPEGIPSAESLLPVSTTMPEPPSIGKDSVDWTAPTLPSAPLDPAFKPAVGDVKEVGGTKVTFEKAGDSVKPGKIVFANQLTSECKYFESGTVKEIVTSGADGKPLCTISSQNGVRYTIKIGDETFVDGAAAKVSVRPDGTWSCQLIGQNKKIEMRDGAVVIELKEGTTDVRKVIEPGKQYQKFEKDISGKYQLVEAELADGTKIKCGYDASGKPAYISEQSKYSPAVFYSTKDGGTTWQKHVSGVLVATGKLEKTPENRLIFSEGETKRIEVKPASDDPGDSRAAQMRRLEIAQDTARKMLTQQSNEKQKAAEKEIVDQWTAEVQKKYGKSIYELTDKELETELPDRNKRIEKAKKAVVDELAIVEKRLNSEIEKHKSDRTITPEAIWSDSEITRTLYGDYIDWLEKTALPTTLASVCGPRYALMPPNNPHKVPFDQRTGAYLDARTYRDRAGAGEFKTEVDLQIKKDKMPTREALDKIGRAVQWMGDVQRQQDKDRLEFEMKVIYPEEVKDNGFPESLLIDKGNNPEAHRAALQALLPFLRRVKGYADAAFMLKDQFDLKEFLPPGCKVVKFNGQDTLQFDWPKDAVLDSKGLKRIEEYEKWLKEKAPKIEQALEAWGTDRKAICFYGDIEGKAYVVVDQSGKPAEYFDPPNPKFDDEKTLAEKHRKIAAGAREINVVKSDFEVELRKDGRFYVKVTTQPCKAELQNYLNIGAKEVSKPFVSYLGQKGPDGQPLGFERGAKVAVRDTTGAITLKPVEELASIRSKQWWIHNGHKAVTLVGDGLAVGAAVCSFGTAAVAWGVARSVSMRVLASATGRLALFGSSYFLNNAKANTDPTLHTLNEVRGVIMVADVGRGGAKSMFGLGGKCKAAAEIGTKIDEAAKSSCWLLRSSHYQASQPKSILHRALGETNKAYGAVVARDLYLHYQRLTGDKAKANPFDAARRATKEGREFSGGATPEEFFKKQNREDADSLFSSYMSLITNRKGIDPKLAPKLDEIMRTTKELLDPSFPKELMEPGVSQEARDKWLTKQKQEYSAKLLEHIYGPTNSRTTFIPNQDLKLAASAALLMLSLKPDGSLPTGDVIAQRSYMKYPTTSRGGKSELVTQQFKLPELISYLKSKEGDSSASTRMLASDLLVKTGARDPIVYASVLKDTLTSSTSTEMEKVIACTQLSDYILNMRLFETKVFPTLHPSDRIKYLTQAYGLSSEDLTKVMKGVAESPSQNKNVRALAAGVLAELDAAIDPAVMQKQIMARAEKCIDSLLGKDKESYDVVLRKELTAVKDNPSSEVGERLSAVIALRQLADLGPYAGNSGTKDFNQELIGIIRSAVSDNKDDQLSAHLELAIGLIDPKALTADSQKELCVFAVPFLAPVPVKETPT